MQQLIIEKNDTKIYWYYLKDAPIRINLYYRAGGLYQPKGKDGIAHLLEHIVVGESQKYPTLELNQTFLNKEQLFFGGHTDRQFVTFSGYCFNQPSLRKLLDFIAEKINNSIINEAKIQREIAAIQNELANYAYDYPNTNQVILHDYLSTGSLSDQKGIVEGNTASLGGYISMKDLEKYKAAMLVCPSAVVVVGSIKPTIKNTSELDRFFAKTSTSLANPERLRKTLSKKGVVIHDKIKNPTLNKSYVGFGWVTRFSTKQDFLNGLIFIRALANPPGSLYALLRYKEQLIYDLSMDINVVCGKYQLFSLHTSSDEAKVSVIQERLLGYLDNRNLVRKAIEQQLDVERSMLGVIYDGSSSVGAYQNYFVPSEISLPEFEEYINKVTVDDVYSVRKEFDSKTMNTVYS